VDAAEALAMESPLERSQRLDKATTARELWERTATRSGLD